MAGKKGGQKKKQPPKKMETSAQTEKKSGAAADRRRKKPRGPSRGSGALSIGLGIFWMLFAYTNYQLRKPIGEIVFGVILALLCLGHAAYNFRETSRREAIERGEIPDPRAASAPERPVRNSLRHRVKGRPKRVLSRTRTKLGERGLKKTEN